ncbi:MAG: GNAT family N-acetyltransferase [Clostridia bacterium]|nr:GNAT family N-acetyltransferase [Clostridia bacterium]
MDNFVDERDYKLLENDKYTFFVLSRIMGGKCELLLTDHERLIVCFSCSPFPVWIWTSDEASEDDMDWAYQIAEENSLLDGEHRFNLKYDLAHYFIKRAAADNKKLSISTNMYAYDCSKLVKPTVIADGSIHHCNYDDVDELVDFLDLFHKELEIDQTDRNSYRLQAEEHINAGNMYFWKDSHGNNVASCKFTPNWHMASIGLVFTRPEFRRKHYAENLVYQVTKLVMDAGYVPMLYTDADYIASNACYGKIGYILKGKLCIIG